MMRLRVSGWLALPFAGLGLAGLGSFVADADGRGAPEMAGAAGIQLVTEQTGRPAAVERLAWLAGCWQGTLSNGATYEEAWLAPRGGIMLGVARMTQDDRAISFEFMRITADDDGTPIYSAQPSGGPPTPFRARRLAEASVTFENPDHDFPQRVLYRFAPPDELHARIEGVRNGQAGGLDFPLRRVACPG